MGNEKYYIAVNAGDRYPLLKTPQDYTEYFNEALSFGDLFDVLRYIEKHGLELCTSVSVKSFIISASVKSGAVSFFGGEVRIGGLPFLRLPCGGVFCGSFFGLSRCA